MSEKRVIGRPFEKGQSGNPAGKKPYTEEEKCIKKMARKHADKALETLVLALAQIEASPSSAVAAAKDLLDRGFGKAEQHSTQDIKVTHHDARERLGRKLVGLDRAGEEKATDRVVN